MAVYLGDKKIGAIITVVTDKDVVNIDYVKQIDLLNSIADGKPVTEESYTTEQLQNIEKTLINLTEGEK